MSFFILGMSEASFYEFANKFIKDLVSHFTEDIRHEFLVTTSSIKLKTFFEEEWEEIDVRALHTIANDVTKKYIDEHRLFNFDKIFYFSFNPEKGKITVKWLKSLDKYS